jgi:hypothetical protein
MPDSPPFKFNADGGLAQTSCWADWFRQLGLAKTCIYGKAHLDWFGGVKVNRQVFR